jgi:hypothetical protein
MLQGSAPHLELLVGGGQLVGASLGLGARLALVGRALLQVLLCLGQTLVRV